MRVRGLKNIAAYYVNKDSEVFWLDLSLAGYRRVKGGERYTTYFDRINEWLRDYGVKVEDYKFSSYVLRSQLSGETRRASPLLLVTLARGSRIIYAVIASFTPGALLQINEILSRAGWKSKFFLDMSAEKAAGFSSYTEEL
ncbi:hypothetical protein IG193_04725 [Infirmifilum lucidum]|uniref:Uncharacterized protein n=1 Tax=Infirmifilum lucidum TaxID=2776706 RepID=A0A7L9FE67_9CREN|nr:hypothetical protein [Infirmifilum lucidum]QOJ78098.1 hypothetical protein IG193_04725 [Infirmifilum lucidum]